MNETLKNRKELLNDCLSAVVNDVAIYDGMSMADKVSLAVSLFQETCKDDRQSKIHQAYQEQKEQRASEPATEKQKKYLEFLKVEVPEGLTKEKASELIEQATKKDSGGA